MSVIPAKSIVEAGKRCLADEVNDFLTCHSKMLASGKSATMSTPYASQVAVLLESNGYKAKLSGCNSMVKITVDDAIVNKF